MRRNRTRALVSTTSIKKSWKEKDRVPGGLVPTALSPLVGDSITNLVSCAEPFHAAADAHKSTGSYVVCFTAGALLLKDNASFIVAALRIKKK